MTALSVLRLVPRPGEIVAGEARLLGRDLIALPEREMQALRGRELAMVFQDPTTSLNPVFPIGWQVAEPLRLHRRMGKGPALARAVELLARVGIADPQRRAADFPHQLSGGMRQRAMIAMALSTEPALLIADEPTTALDVTIQAQVLELLRDLARESRTAIILITHNLGVVASMCERVLVMYAGRVVESGPAGTVLTRPQHPYTWSLLRSIPRLGAPPGPLPAIAGSPPDLAQVPSGCAFHPRCPFRIARCSIERPELGKIRGRQEAACWVSQEDPLPRPTEAAG